MNFDYQTALNQVISKTSEWIETAITMLPNFAVAVLVIILFYFLARFSRYGIRGLTHKVHGNENIMQLVGNTVFVIIFCVGGFIALSILQLDKAVTSLLAGAGIIGLALGFAFQETASNFLAGVSMAFRKPFHIGDIIKTNDYMGVVQELSLRSTIVRTFQGEDVIIPNKTIYYNPIVNYSRYAKRRIDLKIRISFKEDLNKVKKLTIAALEDIVSRDDSQEIKVWFEEFGKSSIHFTVAVWINYTSKSHYRDSVSDAVMKIKKAFDKNDIAIPFPIRTLDFTAKEDASSDKLNTDTTKQSSENKS